MGIRHLKMILSFSQWHFPNGRWCQSSSVCLFAFINTICETSGGKILKEPCMLSTPSFPFYRWGTWERDQGCPAGFSGLTVISEWTQWTGMRTTNHPEPDFWAVSGTLMGLVYEVSCWARADRTIPLECLPGSEDSHPRRRRWYTTGRTPALKGETPQIWNQLGPRESWGSPSHTAWRREASCPSTTADVIPTAAS